MITYHVDSEAVALGLNESEMDMAALLVRRCLREHGISPWERVESEVFSFPGHNLLIARPSPPRLSRIADRAPRLKRK